MASISDIVSPDWLKNTFLAGVDLTLDDGTDYDPRLFAQTIKAAISMLEHDLGIVIDPYRVRREKHDALDVNREGWWPFQLDQRPVLSIDAMRLRYGSFDPVVLPLSWAQVTSWLHGYVQLIPSGKDLSSFTFINSGGGIIGSGVIIGGIFQSAGYLPGYFEFDYLAGFQCLSGEATIPEGETELTVTFPDDTEILQRYELGVCFAGKGAGALRVVEKTPTGFTVSISTPSPAAPNEAKISWTADGIPADIKQAIGLIAAMLPLDVAGDLIVGAGIANLSVSVDGLSQSVGTTSSATNSGYGARVQQFERELKRLLPVLKARYRQINIGIF